MFSEDQGILGFGSYFQRTKGSRSWLLFFKEPRNFGLWLMFSEDQRFWVLEEKERSIHGDETNV